MIHVHHVLTVGVGIPLCSDSHYGGLPSDLPSFDIDDVQASRPRLTQSHRPSSKFSVVPVPSRVRYSTLLSPHRPFAHAYTWWFTSHSTFVSLLRANGRYRKFRYVLVSYYPKLTTTHKPASGPSDPSPSPLRPFHNILQVVDSLPHSPSRWIEHITPPAKLR